MKVIRGSHANLNHEAGQQRAVSQRLCRTQAEFGAPEDVRRREHQDRSSAPFGADDDRRVAEQLETVRLETRKSASGTNAGVSNDEPNAQTYVPGTNMPSAGWMQRCFGCGTWTGQAVSLGAFEVFRCNACARRFRKCADELKARGAGAAAGARDDAADATDARRRGGECHRRAASAESNELTGIASRLREFLLARCPDAGLEHSIANRAA